MSLDAQQLGRYFCLNGVALLAACVWGGYNVDRGLGSLAAANTMLLVVPATRNSVLTWLAGDSTI